MRLMLAIAPVMFAGCGIISGPMDYANAVSDHRQYALEVVEDCNKAMESLDLADDGIRITMEAFYEGLQTTSDDLKAHWKRVENLHSFVDGARNRVKLIRKKAVAEIEK